MFFWTQFICTEKGSLWATPKMDHQLSESFYFIKISYVLTELWIFFYLEWCFLSKKCHFQLKQLYVHWNCWGTRPPPSWMNGMAFCHWYHLQYRISFPTIKNLTETPVEISIPFCLFLDCHHFTNIFFSFFKTD